ncbi:DUF5681 domain-containing protein [Larkinella terrae]|uniref:DUF5681 domain-containing protein n=1 Tax=Larkinella terrae TaxID=2025311 RepID=A0A7K0EIK3_9BACT|nr:DUF5681 domain-containing protein [Larkinella terrae]MRS61673.1 hypothetical protein [Larkinella terrae]
MPNPENIEPHKFPKGVSGNPSGRPKESKNRNTTARIWLDTEENVKNPITKEESRLTQEDIMTLAMIKKARGGDVGAYKALLDSAYGSPKQFIEHTGEDGGPMKFEDLSKLSDDELRQRLATSRAAAAAIRERIDQPETGEE